MSRTKRYEPAVEPPQGWAQRRIPLSHLLSMRGGGARLLKPMRRLTPQLALDSGYPMPARRVRDPRTANHLASIPAEAPTEIPLPLTM